MARFLVGTIPVIGYVTPMMPIVRQLVDRGHDVCWYTGQLFQTNVEASGARFIAMTEALDFSIVEKVPPAWEQQRQSLKGLAQLRFDLKHFFIDHAIGQVRDYQTILQEFTADILLADTFFLGSAWMHELGGPPWAQLSISVMTFPGRDIPPFGLGLQPTDSGSSQLRIRTLKAMTNVVLRGIKKDMAVARSQLGLPDNQQFFFDTLSPYLYLVTTVPSFEYPRGDLPSQVHFIGPPISESHKDFKAPAWWGDLQTEHPIVYVTQDAISTDPNDLIVPTLNALKDCNLLVIATTDNSPDIKLANFELPGNARIESAIPHHQLLPHVDVMITNGDFRSVQTALSYGIPLIAAGQSEDKPEVCARIAWSGVGINLKTQRPKPQQISQTVEEILANKKYMLKAQVLQAEIEQYDSANLAVDYLEALAAKATVAD